MVLQLPKVSPMYPSWPSQSPRECQESESATMPILLHLDLVGPSPTAQTPEAFSVRWSDSSLDSLPSTSSELDHVVDAVSHIPVWTTVS